VGGTIYELRSKAKQKHLKYEVRTFMQDLKERTKLFAIAILKFTEEIPYSRATDNLCKQLIRCATSVAANYRAAKRAKSTADFINKIKITEEESDECLLWLEFLEAMQPNKTETIAKLIQEADELTAIFVATVKTARLRQYVSKRNK